MKLISKRERGHQSFFLKGINNELIVEPLCIKIRDGIMVDQIIESSIKLERTQSLMEYMLAAVIPAILAVMLFSFVMFREFFEFFFLLAIVVALLMIVPAFRIHELHYTIWSRNTLPVRFVTSLIGMVYIVAVSIFSVSMISVFEGLQPDQPLTLGIIGGLVISLIVLMAYNAKYRDAFLSMEKKHFKKDPRYMENKVMSFLSEMEIHYKKYPGDRRWKVALEESGLTLKIFSIGGKGTEIVVENINDDNKDLFGKIREFLDGETRHAPATRPSPSQSLSDGQS
jgi:hypothetical protein